MDARCVVPGGVGRSSASRLGAARPRRVVVRDEYDAEHVRGFVHLGCIRILLRAYCGTTDDSYRQGATAIGVSPGGGIVTLTPNAPLIDVNEKALRWFAFRRESPRASALG